MVNIGKFPILLLAVTAAIFLFGLGQGATVDDRGGYSVLFAIDETTKQPENVGQYIQNLKHSLKVFSNELAKATKGIFYIKVADLLFPKSWTVNDALPAATQSIPAADIRLANEEITPFVDNPNSCGLPGKQINLPTNFFDGLNPGPYGANWKALLTLWARLRWGVWEEHGFPGDSNFPYFYLGDTLDLWEESSCTNEKMFGKYENLNGGACTVNQVNPPPESCRFIPDPIQSASSSLMSFYWLDSIDQFCDKETHNTKAPTRQNYFCNYKSVWEVIRETSDYKIATSGESWSDDNIPLPKFNILQHASTSRPLYVLLDRGALNAHTTPILVQIVPGLANLVGDLEKDLIVTLGEYPADKYNTILELVSWNTLGINREKMIDEIGKWPSNGPYDRHFSSAILKAILEIEKMNFATGSALLVVKTGTYYSTNFEYEESVYMALTRNRIKLYAAEITNPSLDNNDFMAPSLERLAKRTGGGYADLHNFRTAAVDFKILADEIAEEILIPANPETQIEILNQKTELDGNVEMTIDLTKRSTISIQLTIERDAGAVLEIRGPENPMVEIIDEWAKPDSYLRHTHSYVHEFNEAETELHFSYRCELIEDCGGTTGHLIITEKLHEDQEHESSRLGISVSTSAESFGNTIDFIQTSVPFVIYAMVELDGIPVSNAHVIATIYNGRAIGEVQLRDDGTGDPDAAAFDGIYSGSFIPPWDSRFYTVAVQVTRDGNRLIGSNGFVSSNSKHGSSRLLPIDQVDIGCGPTGCGTVPLTEDVSVVADLIGELTFLNVRKYPGINRPEPITDFVAQKSLVVMDGISFRWTVPKILGNDDLKVERYILYGSTKQSDLIGDLRGEIVAFIEDNIQDPDHIQHFSKVLPNTPFQYFALQAFLANSPAPLSNVARLSWEPPAAETSSSTTTATTTTTTPKSTSSSTSSTTTTEDPSNSKPFFETAGGIVLIVFLVLLGLGILGGVGYWVYRKRGGHAPWSGLVHKGPFASGDEADC